VIEAAFALSEGAEKAGLHEVALRWILHHSELSGQHGDAIVVGGSSLEQINDNLNACLAGPLPAALVELVDSVWNIAKKDPPPSWV
jgi:aflatoxin B1 aldehyde reductase